MPFLCTVVPALAACVVLSLILRLRIVDTIWFGAFASGLAAWSLHRADPDSAARNQAGEDRLPIIIALALAAGCFALSLNVTILFASIGIAATSFAIGALVWGVNAARSRFWSFALLLFAFPWTDQTAGLFSFPWRKALAVAAAAIAKPLVGAVSLQGTTLGAEAIKVALPSDAGGLWQAQFFLLCALGLVAGSGWPALRRVGWLALAALFGAGAYLGFIITFFMSVLNTREPAPGWSAAIQIGWWLIAFAALSWIAWRLRSRETGLPLGRKVNRSEAMFPEDASTVQ
jgi:hypothetical protein